MGASIKTVMALAGILNFFMPISMAVDPNCDYYQELVMGQQYYIHNKEYPGLYGPYTSCRWNALSSVGTKIVLTCDVINIPNTQGCSGDRLAISLTGNTDFTDSHNYCGDGQISLVSDSNALAVGLFATGSTTGGRFLCTLVAIQDDTPTTTTRRPDRCDCGWKQGVRIVNGNETGVNEYPAMAGLIDLTTENGTYWCGASIISERYVVTAAHCLLKKTVKTIAVLVGDHNLTSDTDTPYAKLYASDSFIIHEDFNTMTLQNDVALVKTKTNIKFSLFVGPICLPFRYTYETFFGQTITALGWGQLDFSVQAPDVLQQVDLQVIDTNYCKQESDRPVQDSQICTYTPGKDTCIKDSGGPLLWMDTATRRLQLVGVVSYGSGCATDKPSVNTRTSSFLSWIASKTTDTSYCIK